MSDKPRARRALSELAIIVAGVLLALWAENWRQALQERSLGRDYIERLAEDIRRDTAQITEVMSQAVERALYAESVLAAIEASSWHGPGADLVRAVENSWYFAYPDYSRGTFEDLKSTGNLRLIDNTDVKEAIFSYYQAVDRLEQFRDIYLSTQEALSRVVSAVLSLQERSSVMPRPPEYESPFPWADSGDAAGEASPERILVDLTNEPEGRRLLVSMARNQERLHAALSHLRDRAVALLQLLSRE